MMILRSIAVAATLISALALASAPATAADTFAADATHSSVVFRVKHANTSFAWGRFNDVDGTFSLDDADPTKNSIDFKVKTASIDTNHAKRDQHLKSPDFFNAVQYPTITFKSKSVVKSGTSYDVVGDLTLHGVTKPVSMKIGMTGAGKNQVGIPIAGIDTSFVIKRSEFGMDKMVGPVGDEVYVSIAIEGAKK